MLYYFNIKYLLIIKYAMKAVLGVVSAQRRLTGEIPAFCLLGDVQRLPQHTRRTEAIICTQEHLAALYSINISLQNMLFEMHNDK